jgi:N utilization substance protein B
MNQTEESRAKCGLRGMSRFYAVQTLYSAAVSGRPIGKIPNDETVEIFISEDISLSEMDEEFFKLLLKTAEENLSEIDEAIAKNLSENWKMERLDNVMKAILRLGTAELLYLKDVPPKVAFNEYIEISKSFFEKSEVSFINGLLNSVLRKKS